MAKNNKKKNRKEKSFAVKSSGKKTIRSSSVSSTNKYYWGNDPKFGDVVNYDNVDVVMAHPKVEASFRTRCSGSVSFPRVWTNKELVRDEVYKACIDVFGVDSTHFNLRDFAKKILDGLPYGFSLVQAVNWKDKLVAKNIYKVPTSYKLYDQRDFEIDYKGSVYPIGEMIKGTSPVNLERYMCHLFINKAEKSYYSGKSEVVKLYNWILLSNALIEHKDNYYEKLAVPPIYARIEDSLGGGDEADEQLAEIANGLEALKSAGSGAFEGIDEIGSVVSGNNNGEFENAQKEISNLIDVRLLGTSKVIESSTGQAYNSSVKSSEITLQIAKEDADVVQTAVNGFIKYFVEVNFGYEYVAPKMLLESGDFVNYQVNLDMLDRGEPVSKKAMKYAGYVLPEDDDDILQINVKTIETVEGDSNGE